MRYNLSEVKSRLVKILPELITEHFPLATKNAKGWRVGGLSGEKGQSLFVNSEGAWFDHASHEKGGILDLVAIWANCDDFADTLKWACDKTGYEAPEAPVRKTIEKAANILKDISPSGLDYLEARGLDSSFAKGLPIRSLERDKGFALLHNCESGTRCHAIKYFDFNTKGWTSSPDPSHILWGMDFVCANYEGFTEYIVITEGHWDACAYLQSKIPAVSIPSGVNNDKWIEESFDFLSSFERIVLSYDDEEGDPGREGAARVAARISACFGPPRVVSHPDGCKDANDTLQLLGPDGLRDGVRDAKPYSPPEIISGEELLTGAIASITDNPFQLATPFSDFQFHIRDHEMTLYTGYTGHGKSNLLRQILCYLMDTYEAKVCTASFEDQPEIMVGEMLRHQFGKSGVIDTPDVRRFLGKLSVYNTTSTTKAVNNAKNIINLFTHMHNRWGITQFALDNLMMLSAAKDDYEGQIEIVELFRTFVTSQAAHLHVAAHPRKPGNTGKATGPPDAYDIAGPGEIPSLTWNILSFFRCTSKEKQLAMMLQMGRGSPGDMAAIETYDREHPDAILSCEKQRTTGKLPTKNLWFKHSNKTFVGTPEERA